MMHDVPDGFRWFVKNAPDLELVLLQHQLRTYPEDQLFLDCVLEELADRQKRKEPQTA